MPNEKLLDASFAAVANGLGQGELPTAVLAVANSRETIRVESFGPVKNDTIFLLASISKPIFCTAVMQLVDRGMFRLNDPIVKAIPEFAGGGRDDIRLWHLMTHTSGLDQSDAMALFGKANREQLTQAALRLGVMFRPGSRYFYCNASYFVMGELIRRLTGKDDITYLNDEVLRPIGMVDTSYIPTPSPRVVQVQGSPWPDDPNFEYWSSLQWGAGGLWSTAADLVKFGQALMRKGAPVLSPAATKTMTSLHTAGILEGRATGDGTAHYGLGFQKAGAGGNSGPSAELRTPAGFGHGGATGTFLWIEPELDLVFVFLTNVWGLDAPHMGRALNAAIAAFS